MIEAGTWIAVLVLGPGSVAVFAWFLSDLGSVLGGRRRSGRGRRL